MTGGSYPTQDILKELRKQCEEVLVNQLRIHLNLGNKKFATKDIPNELTPFINGLKTIFQAEYNSRFAFQDKLMSYVGGAMVKHRDPFIEQYDNTVYALTKKDDKSLIEDFTKRETLVQSSPSTSLFRRELPENPPVESPPQHKK
jgi:hypothetical protein